MTATAAGPTPGPATTPQAAVLVERDGVAIHAQLMVGRVPGDLGPLALGEDGEPKEVEVEDSK